MPDLPGDPYTVAEAILAAVVSGYSAAGVTLPSKQFVSPGALPAWDGEQVTVSLQRTFQGMPGQEQGTPRGWQVATLTGLFAVEVVRAVAGLSDDGVVPAAGAIGADGQAHMADHRTLYGALQTAVRTESIGSKGRVFVGSIESVGPEGGLAGVRGLVQVLLI